MPGDADECHAVPTLDCNEPLGLGFDGDCAAIFKSECLAVSQPAHMWPIQEDVPAAFGSEQGTALFALIQVELNAISFCSAALDDLDDPHCCPLRQ